MDELRENIKQVRSLNKSVNSLLTSKALNEIMALIDSYSREARIDELEKLHRSEGNGFTRSYDNITDELIDERIAELKALGVKQNLSEEEL